MPTQKNIDEVARLAQKISETKALYLTDYQGLTHEELTKLRTGVKGAGAEYAVIKNTLFRIALKEAGKPSAEFSGATAVIFAYNDPFEPLQLFAETARDRIKAAIAFGEFMVGDKLIRLVEMDPPEVLKAKLVGQLALPMYKLVYSLNWNIRRLVLAIDKVHEKRGGEE